MDWLNYTLIAVILVVAFAAVGWLIHTIMETLEADADWEKERNKKVDD